jgi:hypothetical protein
MKYGCSWTRLRADLRGGVELASPETHADFYSGRQRQQRVGVVRPLR